MTDRGQPKGNRLTYQRSVKRAQDIHRLKLKQMVSTVKVHGQNNPPARHNHLRRNLKKEQMLEERYAEIERENRILLTKMSHIMKTNTLDNVNNSVRYGHSLNKEWRTRELDRVTRENQAILARIQQREPNYTKQHWDSEFKMSEQYLRNCSEHPVRRQLKSAGRHRRMNATYDDGEGYDEEYDEPGMIRSQSAAEVLPSMDEGYQQQSRSRLLEEAENYDSVGESNKEKLMPLEDAPQGNALVARKAQAQADARAQEGAPQDSPADDEEEMEGAATMIQSQFRRKEATKEVQKIRDSKKAEAAKEEEEMEGAATMIQSQFRRKEASKEVQKIRDSKADVAAAEAVRTADAEKKEEAAPAADAEKKEEAAPAAAPADK